MTTKIKVFFSFLAVMAIISVSSFFDIFSGVKAMLNGAGQPLPALEDDTDHDGLPDSEESYWNTDFENPDTDGDGFLDGEEVISQHDPTIPAPNDALVDSNITQKIADLTLGGLIEGSLKVSDPNFEGSVDDLTLAVTNEGLVSFIPSLDISQVKTIESTKESQDLYMQQTSIIWEDFTKALYEEINDIGPKLDLMNNGGMGNPEFINYFLSQREIFNSIAQKGMRLQVPGNLVSKHLDFMAYILQFSEVNQSLAQGKDDPIRASMGFNLFISLSQDFPKMAESFLKD